ncbi:Rad9/Ddc1, partial [Vararia minispora EC-137]
FTRALTCLTKYGDDLTIYATPDSLSFSTTNSSMSAYCRFRYDKLFFSRYLTGGNKKSQRGRKGPYAEDTGEVQAVTGQLPTKILLSVLKHKSLDRTVERCELSLIEGSADAEDDEDGLESKLIIRICCKHGGIVKTHRLVLIEPNSLMAPGLPDPSMESHFAIGPKAMKDMLEHFPSARGIKYDPQLIWELGDSEVQIRSFEASTDNRGTVQLSTELTISVEEFDDYTVYDTPVSIAFHLREFSATIAYAESMDLVLDLRFTGPAEPLYIDVENDGVESLFVVSTSHAPGANSS